MTYIIEQTERGVYRIRRIYDSRIVADGITDAVEVARLWRALEGR